MSLTCTSGLMLSGPSISTCMGNGEWELDLREAECVDASTTVHMTTEKSFDSAALSQEGKIAVASSVTVFVVTSILFFIVGFLSGHFCRKESGKTIDHNVDNKTSIYDDNYSAKATRTRVRAGGK